MTIDRKHTIHSIFALGRHLCRRPIWGSGAQAPADRWVKIEQGRKVEQSTKIVTDGLIKKSLGMSPYHLHAPSQPLVVARIQDRLS